MGRGRTALRRLAALFDRGSGGGYGRGRDGFIHADASRSDTHGNCFDDDDDNSQKQNDAPRDEDLRSVKRRIILLRRQPTNAAVHTTVGFRSRTGWEPLRGQKHNQDTVVAVAPMPQSDRYSLFGILDGHGAGGHLVSVKVAESIIDSLQILLKRKRAAHSALNTTNNSANSDSSSASYPIHLMASRAGLVAGTDVEMDEQTLAKEALEASRMAAYGDIALALARSMVSADRKVMRPPPRGLECSMSGSTGVFVLLHGSTLYCANVGDSRAVLGREVQNSRTDSTISSTRRPHFDDSTISASANNSGTIADVDRDEMSLYGAAGYIPVPLSFDHVPTRAEEKARLVDAGARVEKWNVCDVGEERVWLPDSRVPGLAVTRSFGDSILKPYGLLATPEIYALPLSSADSFIVLGSDGVFDFITNAEVVATVARMRFQSSAQEAAEGLVKMACERWIEDDTVIDDISAAVIYLDVSSPGAREPVEPVLVPIPEAALRHQSMAVLSTGSASFAGSNDQRPLNHPNPSTSDPVPDHQDPNDNRSSMKELENVESEQGGQIVEKYAPASTSVSECHSNETSAIRERANQDRTQAESLEGRKSDSEGRWHFPHLTRQHHRRRTTEPDREQIAPEMLKGNVDEEQIAEEDYENTENNFERDSNSPHPDLMQEDTSSRTFSATRAVSSHAERLISF